ncbi:MAG: HAD-IA family hydrolase, partial [Alphaproteobacteria bacterium]|nr:HAD-IA family hydrolase [Alphaproteobacteria bacterium]
AARQHPLFALTNYSAEKWDDLWEIVDFLHLFEDIVVSGREGLVKPDPRIFDLMLKRFGARAEKTIFIDDNAHNIESAQELGIQAIHFQGPQPLRRDLQTLGLL